MARPGSDRTVGLLQAHSWKSFKQFQIQARFHKSSKLCAHSIRMWIASILILGPQIYSCYLIYGNIILRNQLISFKWFAWMQSQFEWAKEQDMSRFCCYVQTVLHSDITQFLLLKTCKMQRPGWKPCLFYLKLFVDVLVSLCLRNPVLLWTWNHFIFIDGQLMTYKASGGSSLQEASLLEHWQPLSAKLTHHMTYILFGENQLYVLFINHSIAAVSA